MKATDLLKHDHDEVKRIFEEFERQKEGQASARQRLFDQVASELVVHTKVEEEIFYPEFRERQETHDIILEAIEEHHVADQLIEELREMSPSDEAFAAKFEVLRENVLHHAEEEEQELFPKAAELLGDQRLEEMGRQIDDRKQALKSDETRQRRRA